MPSTVRQLLDTAGLQLAGTVPWGVPPETNAAGVYLVTLGDDPDSTAAAVTRPPIDDIKVRKWLEKRPEMTLDNYRPTVEQVVKRISSFWLPDEVVVYVGMTRESLRRRTLHLYETPLGSGRPHAGGHFLKTLNSLDTLFVHFALSEDAGRCKDLLLTDFVSKVSSQSRAYTLDPSTPLPFANLEFPRGKRKRHGLLRTRARPE